MDVVVIIAIIAFVAIAEQLFPGGGGVGAFDAGASDASSAAQGAVSSSSSGTADTSNPFQTIFSGGGTVTSKLQQFAQAIYDFEDPKKNQVATRNNNPGNLKFANQPGATGADDRGFAIFPTLDAGMTALQKQLTLDANRGLTVSQLFSKWLGGTGGKVNNAEGNSTTYAKFVADKVGASPSDSLKTIFGGSNG